MIYNSELFYLIRSPSASRGKADALAQNLISRYNMPVVEGARPSQALRQQKLEGDRDDIWGCLLLNCTSGSFIFCRSI